MRGAICLLICILSLMDGEAQPISTEMEFQYRFKKEVERSFSADTAYRFYNSRPVIIFFTITEQGNIDSFFCIGQVRQRFINAYRIILDSVLKDVSPAFIKEHMGYAMFQVLLEVGSPLETSTNETEIPDIRYGGGYASHSKEYMPDAPLPLSGFNAFYGLDQSHKAFRLFKEKQIKMLLPLMININKQGSVEIGAK